jgi:hypothetical protein
MLLDQITYIDQTVSVLFNLISVLRNILLL